MGCMGEYGLTEYYNNCFNKGVKYQDWIIDQLRKTNPCLIIIPYNSINYQYSNGESATGIEIKFDEQIQKYGNLYIETHEKTNQNISEYHESGIFRKDNTYLWLIGDYNEAFLFGKNHLQQIFKATNMWKKLGVVKRETPTSKGFTLPKENAKNGICIKHFIFKNEKMEW